MEAKGKGADWVEAIQLMIQSCIYSGDGGEEECIEQQLDGQWEQRGEAWVLRYQENPGTPEQVRTTLKATPTDVVVIRQGLISYRQTYRPGESTSSVIETPAGRSEMEVETLDYSREHGHIRFSFHLHMENEPLGRYQLDIRWTEVAK